MIINKILALGIGIEVILITFLWHRFLKRPESHNWRIIEENDN